MAQIERIHMSDSFEISDAIPATPKEVYEAWLHSDAHTKMTGGKAQASPVKGAKFSAWDEYITGTNLELGPNHRIVQAWRTSEFPEDSADSRLEVLLDEVDGGTKITLHHSMIPEGQGISYRQGWAEHYFEPMKRYFSR